MYYYTIVDGRGTTLSDSKLESLGTHETTQQTLEAAAEKLAELEEHTYVYYPVTLSALDTLTGRLVDGRFVLDSLETQVLRGLPPAKRRAVWQVASYLMELERIVNDMSRVYSENDWLNNEINIASVIPQSLDEWSHSLAAKADELFSNPRYKYSAFSPYEFKG
jgi:hypothetical protein